jgi:hypothetical protein
MSDYPIDPEKITEHEDFTVPDLTQAVEGWRAWKVPARLPRYGVAPKLYSVVWDFFWSPRQVSEAVCERCGENTPGESHVCGFYSAKTLAHLQTMTYHRYDAEADGIFVVIGQVANWGKVIEGSLGWRAQKSYPVQLYVPYEAWPLAKPLSEAYGVPVSLKNFLKPTTP